MNTRPDSNEYLPLAENTSLLSPKVLLPKFCAGKDDETLRSLSDLTENQANVRYAEGKWSLKQVVGHIADVERLWNYRILYIARGDAREFSGYDREIFVQNSPFSHLPLREALKDYRRPAVYHYAGWKFDGGSAASPGHVQQLPALRPGDRLCHCRS